MDKEYIIAFDQGTTSCRCLLVDMTGNMIGMTQSEFTQYFPKSGWVEHDAEEIWSTQFSVFESLLSKFSLKPEQNKGHRYH